MARRCKGQVMRAALHELAERFDEIAMPKTGHMRKMEFSISTLDG